LFSQETIQLDRPDQTETVFVVPRNYLQLDLVLCMKKPTKQTNIYLPTILWKFGLNDKVELRVITEFSKTITNSENIYQLQPVSLGFKTALIEKRHYPKISFMEKQNLEKVKSYKEKPLLLLFDLLFKTISMIKHHLVTTSECSGTKIYKKHISTPLL
jgi:hypothetical protein